jgi:hypothetical protein
MPAPDELYSALAADLQAVSQPLFEFGEERVRERGAFLPVGAKLDDTGQVGLLTAISAGESATHEDVLPMLLEGLAHAATDTSVVAVATLEWVRISRGGNVEQPAIKVQVHHRRGLAVTFYVPAARGSLGEWSFGGMIAKLSAGLVPLWPAQS